MSESDWTGVVDEAVASAEADGESREAVVERALVALAEAEGVDVPTADELAAVEARVDELATEESTGGEVDELRERVAELDERADRLETAVESTTADLDALEADVDEDVEDLRERLVRMFRDLETAADEDHDHPGVDDRLDAVAAEVDAVGERVREAAAAADAATETAESVEAAVKSADDRLADVESSVADLSAETDDISEKLSRVATAVVRAQRRLTAVESEQAARRRLDDILATANRSGVRKATCAACGESVRLSLLSRPECPSCESEFDGIDPGRRFIGTSRLTVDGRPALEGDVAAADDDPAGDPVSVREDGSGASSDQSEGSTDQSGASSDGRHGGDERR